MTTKKLLDAAGRTQSTVEPRKYGKDTPTTFEDPNRFCNSMQPTAPQGYRWLHLQPNTRTGT